MLTFECPRCAHRYEDPLEMLGSNVLEAIRCETCGETFWLAIMECDRCANEEVLTWTDKPVKDVLEMLVCGACERYLRYRDPDEVAAAPDPES